MGLSSLVVVVLSESIILSSRPHESFNHNLITDWHEDTTALSFVFFFSPLLLHLLQSYSGEDQRRDWCKYVSCTYKANVLAWDFIYRRLQATCQAASSDSSLTLTLYQIAIASRNSSDFCALFQVCLLIISNVAAAGIFNFKTGK